MRVKLMPAKCLKTRKRSLTYKHWVEMFVNTEGNLTLIDVNGFHVSYAATIKDADEKGRPFNKKLVSKLIEEAGEACSNYLF